jgi:uncharacterized phage infection (PIP) family protein YhgE
MKKGLSVLLIAALLFGFYGGAVNLNDILACKDYWEEAGEKSTADMNKLEDGLNQLKDNEQAYLDGLDQVAEGEQALADGEAELAKGEADYAAAPGKLAAGEKKLAAGKAAYAQGKKDLEAGKKTLAEGKAMLKQLKDGVEELEAQYPTWRHGNEVVHGRGIKTTQEQGLYGVANDPAGQVTQMGSMFTSGSLDPSKISQATNVLTTKAVAGMNGESGVIAGYTKAVTQGVAKAYVDSQYGDNIPSEGDEGYEQYTQAIAKATQDPAIQGKAKAMVQQELGATTADSENVYSMIGTLIKKGVISNAEGSPTAPLYSAYSAKTAFDTLAQLAAGKKQIQDKLLPLLGKVGSNEAAVEKLGGKKAVAELLKNLQGTDDQFEGAMDMLMKKAPELIKMVSTAVNQGEKELAAGKKKLAAGAKELKAGEKTLAQGYADYAAAPGKLEDGRQQLADGRAQLAAGKDKLAQYEDGEQQVRDGLATLVGTEADLELESILDRLNGDSDFDNGDNHLELDEGLAAVDVGRGYQAEDGELITKEIMTRAIGTGGLLAAGVLAVLAAILSFMKKNKGAGVLAILSAVAGAFGAYEATQAGTYFSSIAGSTVGQTGMIAAGILAAVALVHSIAHFTAKKEA